MSETLAARFAKHVNRGPHPAGSVAALKGCHLWTGATNDKGYGVFGWSKSRTMRAHRAAYELAHGDPGTLKVLHRCDNPPCVNPEHLHTGTQRQNMVDRRLKGRWAGGRKASLTREEAAHVVRRVAVGEPIRAIARSHGVAESTIRSAARK